MHTASPQLQLAGSAGRFDLSSHCIDRDDGRGQMITSPGTDKMPFGFGFGPAYWPADRLTAELQLEQVKEDVIPDVGSGGLMPASTSTPQTGGRWMHHSAIRRSSS